jgi:tetratricopeptide (TPR) repeat protein
MPDKRELYAPVIRFARVALMITLGLLALATIACIAMVVSSLFEAIGDKTQWSQFVRWLIALLITVGVGAWVVVLFSLIKVFVSAGHASIWMAGHTERVESLLTDEAESFRKILDVVQMSDKAKSLLYREKEIEAFRETINHELMRQNYGAAETMIDEIEQTFGYSEEANQLRELVTHSREATIEEMIDQAIARIESHIGKFDWSRALRETRRLVSMFPDNDRLAALPEKINVARNQHKRNLLQTYGEAARKNDVDESIRLLKELDSYLSPQEAAALKESARGVFKARLNNLGVQFSIHVVDERWDQAIAAGEQIIDEFPNSRMAHEVRGKMDALQARVNEQAS